MDAERCWQRFARTGRIDHYLDYRRAAARCLPEEGTMDEFVIMGLVLQEIEYGESDRIIKILTAEKGLITLR